MAREIRTTRLYLTTWQYNMALILKEMEHLIKANGGVVCSNYEQRENYSITNRRLTEALNEKSAHLERCLESGKAKKEYVDNLQKEVNRLRKLNNDNVPVLVNHITYIGFVLNGDYYYFQVDDNPFFDFYVTRVKCNEGKMEYENNYYLEQFNKQDSILGSSYYEYLTQEEINEIAKNVYDVVSNIPYSKIYHKKGNVTRKLIVWDV